MAEQPKYPVMTNHIKAWLLVHELEQRDVARMVGVTPQFVSLVILGKRYGARVRNALVKAGMPPAFFQAAGSQEVRQC